MEHFCRNCLFDSISREDFNHTIEDYIKSLSPEDKAGERLYKQRLEICSRCEKCLDGLCRVCGCFVLARAAKSRACCPAAERRW